MMLAIFSKIIPLGVKWLKLTDPMINRDFPTPFFLMNAVMPDGYSLDSVINLVQSSDAASAVNHLRWCLHDPLHCKAQQNQIRYQCKHSGEQMRWNRLNVELLCLWLMHYSKLDCVGCLSCHRHRGLEEKRSSIIKHLSMDTIQVSTMVLGSIILKVNMSSLSASGKVTHFR